MTNRSEKCDLKGLYKKARAGEIKQFTGKNVRHVEPESAELVVDIPKTNWMNFQKKL